MPKRKQFFRRRTYKRKKQSGFLPSDSSISSVSSVSSVSCVSSPATSDSESILCTTPIIEDKYSQDVNNTQNGLIDEIDRTRFVPLRASSPVILRSDESCHGSDLSSIGLSDDDDDDDNDDFLYIGSNITSSYLSQRLARLSSKHALSDAAVADILNVIADVLPLPNKCATLYKHKRNLMTHESKVKIQDCDDGEIYLLPFAEQIELIVSKYPNSHSLEIASNPGFFSDISTGKLFPSIQPNTLYFILNTDGFSPILSRKMQVWPLLLSMVNLPPHERNKLCNIIMFGFYIGKSKPPWDIFFNHLVDAMKTKIGERKLSCKIVALVADAPAKSSCCNIQNTNARYV